MDIEHFTANLEEEGSHYEGDMILPIGSSKVTINNLAQRWPNGQVPYVIEGSFSKHSPSNLITSQMTPHGFITIKNLDNFRLK